MRYLIQVIFLICILFNFIIAQETRKLNTLEDDQSYKRADESNLRKLVSELSAPEMYGRLTGSEKGTFAEKYVETKMFETGLKVLTQTVAFPLYEIKSPISLEMMKGEKTKFEYLKDFREIDYTGSGKLSAEAVFVGYGLEYPGYSSYKSLDVKGKIVVILTGKPDSVNQEFARIDKKIDLAYLKGARGAILIPTGKMAVSIEQRGLEAEMFATDLKRQFCAEFYHPEFPAIFLHKSAAEKILGNQLEAFVNNPLSKSLNLTIKLEVNSEVNVSAISRNIIGILEGSDEKLSQEVIIIGAHYDHLGAGGDGKIFYGASDNASGTAAVLEAARFLSTYSVKPKRTIVFALWCAEEQGLHGSNFYVNKNPLFPLENTRLMIQLDCFNGDQIPYLTNVNENELIQRFAGEAIRNNKIEPWPLGGQCASDDCAFLAKGIPAYRFGANGHNHHQITDTYENLNLIQVYNITNIIIDGLLKTAYK